MAEPERIEMVSEALVLLGEEAITSLSVGIGVGQILGSARFDRVADLLLSLHPWDFTKQVAVMTRVVGAVPDWSAYSGHYTMPTGCLKFVCPLIDNQRLTDWQIIGTTVYLDASADDVIAAEFHGRVDEALWPPPFREAVVYRLAGEFCLPVREDSRAQQGWMQMADAHLRIAKHAHAVQAPRPAMPTGRFQALRHR